jgi:hypothetical protein
MADEYSEEPKIPIFDETVPEDVYSEPKSTGNPVVNQLRDELEEAIDFLGKKDPRFKDPLIFFKEDTQSEGEIIADRMKRYETYGCEKPRKFYYWRDKNDETRLIKRWWSEVVIVTSKNLTEADYNEEFTLFVDFHGGGFVSIVQPTIPTFSLTNLDYGRH